MGGRGCRYRICRIKTIEFNHLEMNICHAGEGCEWRVEPGCCTCPGTRHPLQATSPLQTFVPSHLLDWLHPSHQSTAPNHVQSVMEGADKSDKASPPLQIDPKWYVIRCAMLPELLTAAADPASKTLSDLSSNPSRPMSLASTSTRCTRGRRPSTTPTMSRSTTRTSTPP